MTVLDSSPNTKTTSFTFGKYKGLSYASIFRQDPDYIYWLVRNVSGTRELFDRSQLEALEEAVFEQKIREEFYHNFRDYIG